MRAVVVPRPVDCAVFRRFVHAFLAEELAEGERLALQDHLDRCPACARYAEVEASFERVLRARLVRAAAPEALRARVRAALAAESAPARRGGLWASAAAALLLSVLAAPTLAKLPRQAPVEGALRLARAATVVDRDCALAGRTLCQQRLCTNPQHMNGLQIGEGYVLAIHPDRPRAAELCWDRALRGRRVHVEALYFPALGVVQVVQARLAPAAAM